MNYKLYNPATQKVILTRDVEFDASATWDWTQEDKEKHNIIIELEKEIVDLREPTLR